MNQSPFGAKAKSKIMAAARKFGITVSPDGRALDEGVNAPEVERRFTGEDKRSAYVSAAAVEVREDERGKKIGGYASVFNRMSRPLGGFVEEIMPDAFSRASVEGWAGAVCRFNHDPNLLLGTIAGRTLQLHTDRTGLYYDVLPPQSRADILELVQRGDIRHSSFAFRISADGEEWTTSDQNYPLRRVHDVELVDVAPVVNPAYPDATAGLRSLAMHKDIEFEEVRMLADQDRLAELFIRTDARGRPVVKREACASRACSAPQRSPRCWTARPTRGGAGLDGRRLRVHRVRGRPHPAHHRRRREQVRARRRAGGPRVRRPGTAGTRVVGPVAAWLKARAKAATALVGALAVLGVALAPANKWVAVAVAVATALGVYSVPNKKT